jgi:hypothetical protein
MKTKLLLLLTVLTCHCLQAQTFLFTNTGVNQILVSCLDSGGAFINFDGGVENLSMTPNATSSFQLQNGTVALRLINQDYQYSTDLQLAGNVDLDTLFNDPAARVALIAWDDTDAHSITLGGLYSYIDSVPEPQTTNVFFCLAGIWTALVTFKRRKIISSPA